jgi:hypothetical protein
MCDPVPIIEFFELIDFLLKQEGSVTIDMQLIKHNDFLDEKDLRALKEEELEDKIIIGEKGRQITMKDIRHFIVDHFQELYEAIKDDISSGSGRSYYYEGFTVKQSFQDKDKEINVILNWGS